MSGEAVAHAEVFAVESVAFARSAKFSRTPAAARVSAARTTIRSGGCEFIPRASDDAEVQGVASFVDFDIGVWRAWRECALTSW